MRKTFTRLTAVLGLAVATATGAQALTTINGSSTSGGALTPVTSTFSGGATVDFGWSATKASAWVEFTTTRTFDLFFDDYSSSDTADRSAAFLVNKTTLDRIVNMPTTCSQTSAAVLPEIQGDCNFIGAVGNPIAYDPSSVDPLYENVAAGTYYLGFYEAAQPSSGVINFSIAEVPLPAGGLLLFGALGGLAALRKRKKAA